MLNIENHIGIKSWDSLYECNGRKLYYVVKHDAFKNLDPVSYFKELKEMKKSCLLFPILDSVITSQFLIKQTEKANVRFTNFEKERDLFYIIKDYPSVKSIPIEKFQIEYEETGISPYEIFESVYFLNSWFPIIGS